jgi:hypothetical protein
LSCQRRSSADYSALLALIALFNPRIIQFCVVNLKNRLELEWWLVNILRRKIVATSLVITFVAVMCIQSAFAENGTVEVYAWTDKTQYNAGDSGKLHVTIKNGLEQAITIDAVKIWYPWHAYHDDDWVGNMTIEIETPALSGGEARDEDIPFDIPTDGRLLWSDQIYIEVWTVEFDEPFTPDFARSPSVNVVSTHLPMMIKDIGRWMTILTAVIVICTIIIAAVIFLSTRGPTYTMSPSRTKA